MNTVCITSYFPSATNTATVRNYDELCYTCQELSTERKTVPPSEMNTCIYWFLEKNIFQILWIYTFKCRNPDITKYWWKPEKNLIGSQLLFPDLPTKFLFLMTHIRAGGCRPAVTLHIFSGRRVQSKTMEYWYPSQMITSLSLLTPKCMLIMLLHKSQLLTPTSRV